MNFVRSESGRARDKADSLMLDKVLCEGAFGTPELVPSHGFQVLY